MEDKKVIASAPGRVGLLGDPSDINGGCVISMAIDLYAHVSIEASEKFMIESNGKIDTILAFNKTHDLVKACVKRTGIKKQPIKIKYWTEIPFQAGLGGSAAICVACIGALRKFFELDFNDFELAEKATFVELKDLHIIAGQQDRYISTFGGLAYMDFKGKEKQREIDGFGKFESLPTENIPLLIAPIKRKLNSGDTLKTFRNKFLSADKFACEINNQFILLAKKGRKHLLDKDWNAFGKLMIKNKLLEDKISPAISKKSNRLYEDALAKGAFGARTSGSMSTTLILGNKELKNKLTKLYPKQQFVEPRIGSGLMVRVEDRVRRVRN